MARNVDKDRGFVNGAVADVEHVLKKDVCVVKTPMGVRLLVHKVSYKHKGSYAVFLPVSYGYAMTIRRAQGSTLGLVGLWFDHVYPPERGYGYVGSSRVRRATDLYLLGKVKRTDWLPVDGDGASEQLRRGSESETTDEDSQVTSSDRGASAESPESDRATTSESSAHDTAAEDSGCSDGGSDPFGPVHPARAAADRAHTAGGLFD